MQSTHLRTPAVLGSAAPGGAPLHRPALGDGPLRRPAPGDAPVRRPTFAAEGPGEDPPPGDRIRAARAAADLNREQLAERIGSSARTVRRLEDAKRRATPEELRSIAEACRVPEWFLVHGWRGHERFADR